MTPLQKGHFEKFVAEIAFYKQILAGSA